MSKYHQKNKYLTGTQKILAESQKETRAYSVDILEKSFRVLPNVFSPKYFFDTAYFAEVFPSTKGKKVLEIGPGSGIISVLAALGGAKHVTSIDINPSAVANTNLNAKLHDVAEKMTILQGDVYQPLRPTDKFDIIFWNTPFGLVHKRKLTDLERAVYDEGYEATTRFIDGANQHLLTGGLLLIGFSSTLGHAGLLRKLLKAAGFSLHQIQTTQSMETYPVKFELISVKKEAFRVAK